MSTNEITLNIEKRARKAKLSIAELCRRANVANSTFTRWKSGHNAPNTATLKALDAVLSKAEKSAGKSA